MNSSLRKHDHYWFYDHTQRQGRTDKEVAVIRYCSCGVKQIAYASNWQMAPKAYDLSDIDEQIELLNK